MKFKIVFLILVFCFIGSASKSQTKLLDLANEAYSKENLKLSVALYKKIASDTTVDAEARSEAFEKLSFIFARFYQNYDSALLFSLKNLKNAHQYCLASGYLLLKGRYPDAIDFAHKAVQISCNYKDSMESYETFANNTLKYAEYQL